MSRTTKHKEEKCPFCKRPNVIDRPWRYDKWCGWCGRIVERWVEKAEKPLISPAKTNT
jgi:hypothetical protein